MMKTKATALCLALMLMIGLMAGCGSNPADPSKTDATTGQSDGTGTDETLPGEENPGNTDNTDNTDNVDNTDNTNENGEPNHNGGDTQSQNQGPTNPRSSSGTNAPSPNAGKVNKTGFPIVKDKINLKFMVIKEAAHGDFNKMAFTTDYEKKTNIHINWELVNSSERDQVKALTLSSGNYPDAMFLGDSVNSSDIAIYGSEGIIQPIGHLLSDWAPNLNKLISEDSNTKKSVTALDGKIYSIPHSVTYYDHSLFRNKMFINTEWLARLNKKVPTTYNELLDVLRAFKNSDANGNGQKTDEIPMVVNRFNPMLCGAPQGINWDWKSDRMCIDLNGKVNYFMATDAFKDSIGFFRTLWSENLMDKEVFTSAKTVSAVVGTTKDNVGCFIDYAGSLTLSESNLGKFQLIAPVKSTTLGKGAVASADLRGRVNPFSGVITIANKNVEATLRWLDYFFTPEGAVYVENGPSGAGIVQKLPTGKYQKVGKTDAARYQVAPGWVLPSWFSKGYSELYQQKDAKDISASGKFFLNQDEKASISIYSKLLPAKFIPNLFFTTKDAEKLTTKGTAVHSYANAQGMAFVTGEAGSNFETGWNDYISELKRLGMDEIVSIYQKQYNAYSK